MDVTPRHIQQETQTPVILVAGNHELYRGDWHDTLVELRLEARRNFNVHFLEQETVTIKDTRFLGCTLWSDFEINGSENARFHMAAAERGIVDFQLIRSGLKMLTPQDMVNRFHQSYAWLDAELAKPFDGKTVVVTHFGPHRAAIHPRYLASGMDALTPYFTADCSDLMKRHHIDAWLYGHLHNSVDVVVSSGTRLIVNSRGYPNEDPEYTRFNKHKVISL